MEGRASRATLMAYSASPRRHWPLSIVPGVATEGIGLLHERFARHDFENFPVVFLVLHIGRLLAADYNDRTDQLVIGAAEMHVADHRRERFALLVLFDHVRRVERARLCHHARPDGERHIRVLRTPLGSVVVFLIE